MTTVEKNIGESSLKGTPRKRLSFIIGEGAVTTPKISSGAVTPDKLSEDSKGLMQSMINTAIEDLQNQIDGYNEHGVFVSNRFGNDPHIGISQKTLTDAINDIWTKIEDITGEVLHGFSMTVTPTYFINETGCTIHVTASSDEAVGVFEKLSFYINGELVREAENVDYFETDIDITETTVLKCVAQILGVEYERSQVITHYNSYWLGAGDTYSDIMDTEHLIPITEGMRSTHDITVEEGEHIIIIVGESLREGFIRADINSVEIPFTESSVTVNGNVYKVFTSVNTYHAGTYNIDLNG